ncbi:BsuPI-related putative proteinase inhibitor [Radiobacillus deserti]|uniref:Intracellular proteinase inhibitor (BsuPI) n=1 Tax=Radiobacillus deserti TaxID=2594883 RepID=A0A516KEX4_9BACI|nr:BsuPI-related putative proteinase inhibitor [Radiobacillus deserti]QDP39930.1 intracellular proteinase inhibitor (BsuPI) [Radiobacillus deserti]
MKKWLTMLGILIILSACGTTNADSDSKEQPIQPLPAGEKVNGSGDQGSEGIVAGEVEATLREVAPLQYVYTLKNQTEKPVKLDFTSSQRYDFSVETKEGKQVYLYSSTASFIQALGEEEIKQAEELSYTLDLNQLGLSSGDYVLTAWMTPKEGKKYKVSTEFTVE